MEKMHEAYTVYPPATIPVQIESMTGYGNIFFTRILIKRKTIE